MKKTTVALLLLVAVVAAVPLLAYGTLSPCGWVKVTVKQHLARKHTPLEAAVAFVAVDLWVSAMGYGQCLSLYFELWGGGVEKFMERTDTAAPDGRPSPHKEAWAACVKRRGILRCPSPGYEHLMQVTMLPFNPCTWESKLWVDHLRHLMPEVTAKAKAQAKRENSRDPLRQITIEKSLWKKKFGALCQNYREAKKAQGKRAASAWVECVIQRGVLACESPGYKYLVEIRPAEFPFNPCKWRNMPTGELRKMFPQAVPQGLKQAAREFGKSPSLCVGACEGRGYSIANKTVENHMGALCQRYRTARRKGKVGK